MVNSEDKYLNMGVLSLTLIFLGIFITFFVRLIPLPIGVIICLVGVILGIKYFYNIIKLCLKLKKEHILSDFAKAHLPALLCILVFLLMIGSFVSATVIHEGTVYIDPDSRKLIIYSTTSDQAVSVKGPYVIDAAIENESNLIRMPLDAMDTLSISANDTLDIGGQKYNVQEARMTESDTLRLPIKAKEALNISDGDIIQNIYLGKTFTGSEVIHNNSINSSFFIVENFILSSGANATYDIKVLIDNEIIYDSFYILDGGNEYKINFNGSNTQTISFDGNNYESSFDYNGHQITIKIQPSRAFSMRNLIDSPNGVALDLNI